MALGRGRLHTPLQRGGQLNVMEGLWVFFLSFLFFCYFYGMYVSMNLYSYIT